ncbi:PPE domain-containing protein [Amycolatopsis sp. GM8]|uniref:PPE domain-containing protein n=1 Tax=Amycolatopsis sp. GM8 TaxID=2896530 RepID=UPI0027E02084|nr:PPE domain-containing protein [Amycolatopsis sp. GM8]
MALSAPGSAFDDITEDPNSRYYIGPKGTQSASGDEIRAEVTREVDTEIANGWLGDVVSPETRDQTIQRRYEQQIADSRNTLHNDLPDNLELRDHGTPPTTMWDNATHPQMVEAISQNADPAAVAVTSEEWVSLGNELTDHQQNLADAINDSMSNWQGAGGDAAREHLANVGKWLGTTAQGATLTGRQQEIHSQTLNETQKQMAANPPVQFDVQQANAQLQTIRDPAVYAQQASVDMNVMAQQQAARQQAARVMTQYDQTVGTATSTPAFPPPPKLPGAQAATAPLRADGAPGGANSGVNALRDGGAGAAGLPGGGSGSGIPGGGGSGIPGGGVPGGSGPGAGDIAGIPGGGGPGAGDIPGIPGGGGPGAGDIPSIPGGGIPGGGLPGGSQTGGGIPGGGSIPSIPDTTIPSSSTDPSSFGGGLGGIPGIGQAGGTNGDITSRLGGIGPTGNPLGGIDGFGGTSGGTGGSSGLGNIPGIGGTGGSSGIKGIGGLGGIGGLKGSIPGLEEPGSIKGSTGFGSGGTSGLKGIGGLGGGTAGEGVGGAGLKGIGGSGGSGASGSRLGAGAASGAAAAEEAAAARGGTGAAGKAGASGSSGLGGAHGGRGQGSEDKEHKVADYLEGDPELFEPEQVVAPPVIGDWKKSKEDKKK